MRMLRPVLTLVIVIGLTGPSIASAEERHVVGRAELSQAVAEQVARQDADRVALRDVLARPEVRDVAARTGIDLDRVNASVDTLSGAALTDAAAAARQASQSLVGGASTITFSATTIIIALLVVILIIVAVD